MPPGEPEPGNPFVFDRPLEDPRALVGRTKELAQLRDAVGAGGYAVVEGPHGHGKTSLVNAALASFAAAHRGMAARVDCAGVLTAADFARRLEDAYARAWAEGPVEEVLVEGLEALPFRLAAEGDSTTTPELRLGALLALGGEAAEKVECRAVVCFDDFQDALVIPGVVAAIENYAPKHGARVVHLFAGPDLGSFEPEAWGRGVPTVTVGTIEPIVFAGEISRCFKATGRDAGEASRALAVVGAGHPQRTNLLAAQLWELVEEGERATLATAREAIDKALVRCTPEFEVRWQSLHGNERRVAVAIAQELAPQGTRAQRATGLAGYGAAQRALQGLKASGVAKAQNERTTLTDPLFAEWLRQRYERIPPETGWEALRRMRAELQRGGITRGM